MKDFDVSEYSDSVIADAKSYSDVATIVFFRAGGEGGDLPFDTEGITGGKAGQHYLKLSENERNLLNLVKEKFGTTIVLVNSSNPMELGFLDDETIDGALWIGGTRNRKKGSRAKCGFTKK